MPEITLILALGVIAGYLVYCFYRYIKRKGEKEILETPDKEQGILNDLMEIIFNQAHTTGGKTISSNKISKVFLMEKLNLSPKKLKECLLKLGEKNLTNENPDSVTITPFGIEFFKNFRKTGKWRQ